MIRYCLCLLRFKYLSSFLKCSMLYKVDYLIMCEDDLFALGILHLGKSTPKNPPLKISSRKKKPLWKTPPRKIPAADIIFLCFIIYFKLHRPHDISFFSPISIHSCNLDTRGRWNFIQEQVCETEFNLSFCLVHSYIINRFTHSSKNCWRKIT